MTKLDENQNYERTMNYYVTSRDGGGNSPSSTERETTTNTKHG